MPIRGRFHVNITAAIVIRRRPGGGPGTEDAPLSIGLRGNCIEASRLDLSPGPVAALDQSKKSEEV